MKILHEWNFHNRVCRVVESEPGIVHFEEATRTTGDPSIMLFKHTPTPMGAANEIIQLSMALAEANVINRDLSASIAKFQEERNRSDKEIEELRARVSVLEIEHKAALAEQAFEMTKRSEIVFATLRARVKELESALVKASKLFPVVPPIPLPEGESEADGQDPNG